MFYAFLYCSKHISKICLKCIFYKYDLYKIYVFKIRFFPLFLFKFTFFKNGKNVYNVLKLCIFYKSIANKKTYYFYIISILDFLLFFIRKMNSSKYPNYLNKEQNISYIGIYNRSFSSQDEFIFMLSCIKITNEQP